MAFEIEDGVAIPKSFSFYFSKLERLNVGNSIFFPDEPNGSQSSPAKAAFAYSAKRKKRVKFKTRSCDGGVRIWRIA